MITNVLIKEQRWANKGWLNVQVGWNRNARGSGSHIPGLTAQLTESVKRSYNDSLVFAKYSYRPLFVGFVVPEEARDDQDVGDVVASVMEGGVLTRRPSLGQGRRGNDGIWR